MVGQVGRRRVHDYELIKRLIASHPAWIDDPTTLAVAYNRLSGEGVPVIDPDNLRALVLQRYEEFTGRERPLGYVGRRRQHDYDLIGRLLLERPSRLHEVTLMTRLYREAKGQEIKIQTMSMILRRHGRRLLKAARHSASGGEVNTVQE